MQEDSHGEEVMEEDYTAGNEEKQTERIPANGRQ